MNVGTKSLLFGAHTPLIHTVIVLWAWKKIYGLWPTWKELVCIAIHDLGYWGKPNMDGPEGSAHPELGARLAASWLDTPDSSYYEELCLYHSRSYAKKYGAEPSKLCWADKLAISLEPWWLYLPRALATGEVVEYHAACVDAGLINADTDSRTWLKVVKKYLADVAIAGGKNLNATCTNNCDAG